MQSTYWLPPATLPRGTVKSGKACLISMAPIEWILTWPTIDPTTQMLSGNIVLQPGRLWLKALLVSKSTPLLVQDDHTSAGILRQISVTGRTAGHSVAIHQLLNNYPHHRWVMLYKEAGMGITYVIGSPKAGMQLTTAYDTQHNTINSLEFSISSLTRPLVYSGVYTLSNGTVLNSGTTIGVEFYTVPNGTTPTNTFTPIANLRSHTILWVSRSGMKDLQPVNYPPTIETEIQFNPITNTFTLHPDWPLSPAETFVILYR